MGMTVSGWIFFSFAWTAIIALVVFCFCKVLETDKKHVVKPRTLEALAVFPKDATTEEKLLIFIRHRNLVTERWSMEAAKRALDANEREIKRALLRLHRDGLITIEE